MKVQVWGSRGSFPLAENSAYGGNTSCVTAELSNRDLLVFDAGSGLVPLGQKLAERGGELPRIRVFLSHLHWDHILGLPFFAPFFLSGPPIEVFLPRDPVGATSEKLWKRMQNCGWAPEDAQRCRILLREVAEGEVLDFGAFQVRSTALSHPVMDFGYRVDTSEHSFCYCTDVEPVGEALLRSGLSIDDVRCGSHTLEESVLHPRHRELVRFMEGADLCLHESMYRHEDYVSKVGWGHCPVCFATEIAYLARVRKLRLFHYAPDYSDLQLDDLEAEALEIVRGFGGSLDVALAKEGDEYCLC